MRLIFTTLDRYLAKEIVLTGLAVLLVLLLVVMSAEVAYWLAAVVEGRIHADMLMPVLSVSVVKYSIVLLPLSMMLTIMLVFGRLYRDSEMAAIMSAGCGPLCWYRPVLFVALPATLLLLVMTLFIMPELNAYKQQLLNQANRTQDLDSLAVGRFNRARDGDAVFFIESRNSSGNQVEGVFFQQQLDDVDSVNIAGSARSIRHDNGDVYLLMQGGRQYIGNAGSRDYRIVTYREYAVRMPEPVEAGSVRQVKALPSSALLKSKRPAYQAELHWRITMPVGMLILVLLAVPLSYTRPRSGRFAKLALALVLYLVYSNLLGVSFNWMQDGVIPVWLASWWVHALALLLLLGLFYHYGYLTRRRQPAG